MDGLDLLKKHWNEDQSFPKINKEEIREMLHKSSSSIVKWIFVICCLELLLFLVLGIVIPSDKEQFKIFEIIDTLFEICSYGIVLYFVWTFYKHMKEIKSTNNTKALIENILLVRKSAEKYIQINLLLVNLILGTAFISVIFEKWVEQAEINGSFYFQIGLTLVIMILVGLLFHKMVKGYYYLIYGLLLKKLNKNYEELVKLEE